MLKRIPKVEFPSINNYDTKGINEEIVSISKAGIIVDSQYYKQGIQGAYKDCYARETVVDKLLHANDLLPNGLQLKVYDAYRPICIQENLWDMYRNKIVMSNSDLSDEEIDKRTSFFVSKPSYDLCKPSLHNTGGAVDVTLVDEYGKELNMGTEFDDFTEKAWTNHFEEFAINEEVQKNRRILYWAMINAGFTNLPSEWWHYDYGTKFWGYFKNKQPLYRGVLDIDFPNRLH